jgi:hypothetical protein
VNRLSAGNSLNTKFTSKIFAVFHTGVALMLYSFVFTRVLWLMCVDYGPSMWVGCALRLYNPVCAAIWRRVRIRLLSTVEPHYNGTVGAKGCPF